VEIAPTKRDGSRVLYDVQVQMKRSGVFDYGFRLTPRHPLMAYRNEFNLVRWL
jgi:hypothetical protein